MWYKVKKIYMRQNWVENQVRPRAWTPWANTLAYFPFENDILDHSWNSTVLSGSMTADTIWYKTTWIVYFTSGNANFVGWWFKINSVWSIDQTSLLEWQKNAISYYAWHNNTSFRKKVTMFYTLSPTYYSVTSSWDISTWWWHYLAYSYYDWKIYICKDWTVELLYNWSWAYNWDKIYLQTLTANASWNTTFSNVIAESVWWSSIAMTNYYNNTKSNYWL